MIFRIFLVLAISGSALGASDCQDVGKDKGKGYSGSKAMTKDGDSCQAWASQAPHKHKYTGAQNFCRNPDGEDKGVWCYTTNPNKRWAYCNVANCSDLPVTTEAPTDPIVVPVTTAAPTAEEVAAAAAAEAANMEICEKYLCPKLKTQHELVVMARLAYHCPNHPGKGEQTMCDKHLLKGMQNLTEFNDHLLDMISNTDACNSTEEICASLHRLQDYTANSLFALCKKPFASEDCTFWHELMATPEILAAKATCSYLGLDGAKFEDCVVKVAGADNKDCMFFG